MIDLVAPVNLARTPNGHVLKCLGVVPQAKNALADVRRKVYVACHAVGISKMKPVARKWSYLDELEHLIHSLITNHYLFSVSDPDTYLWIMLETSV